MKKTYLNATTSVVSLQNQNVILLNSVFNTGPEQVKDPEDEVPVIAG